MGIVQSIWLANMLIVLLALWTRQSLPLPSIWGIVELATMNGRDFPLVRPNHTDLMPDSIPNRETRPKAAVRLAGRLLRR
jgi:hypothetical protein